MNIQSFLQLIHQTQEEEILCSDCLDLVNQYVDLELDGQPAEMLMPHLKHHLDMCPVCQEEYTLLRALAGLEPGDPILSIEELQSYFRA